MANGCKIPHPLKREGTFRFERFPVELEDAYVKIDERTILDLVRQTKGYAGLVRYYNELNIEESSWTAFFDELTEEKLSKMASRGPDQNVSPHLALLLAFLKIFGIAQENLNQVTKRHLDYYYKVILQLSQQPAIPDKVAVLFEPEKRLARHGKLPLKRLPNTSKHFPKITFIVRSWLSGRCIWHFPITTSFSAPPGKNHIKPAQKIDLFS